MMDEQNWGDAEPIRQGVHDLVHAIGKHLGLIPDDAMPSTAHDKAVSDMNKQANDQRVQEANQSFIKPDQAAKIRQKASK